MEWENVSKQITGTIAGMLTARAHDKIWVEMDPVLKTTGTLENPHQRLLLIERSLSEHPRLVRFVQWGVIRISLVGG